MGTPQVIQLEQPLSIMLPNGRVQPDGPLKRRSFL
jgi:hypothetical protein